MSLRIASAWSLHPDFGPYDNEPESAPERELTEEEVEAMVAKLQQTLDGLRSAA